MKKFVLSGAVAGAMILAASKATAVMGLFTISGTVQSQSQTSKDVPTIQKNSFTQKDLLFILEQGTGDASITNKPTKIFYDPDAYNSNIVQWVESNEGLTNSYYGIFYYSNSMAGLVKLDGFTTNYYSYMEFDYQNTLIFGLMEGFWNPAAMEANSVYSTAGNSDTEIGNAILYVHSDPSKFNLLGEWTSSPYGVPSESFGFPSAFFYANDAYQGFYQAYAAVIHGPITFKLSFSQSHTNHIESESFTLKGSGDMNYNNTNATISGTATFTGKGLDDL